MVNFNALTAISPIVGIAAQAFGRREGMNGKQNGGEQKSSNGCLTVLLLLQVLIMVHAVMLHYDNNRHPAGYIVAFFMSPLYLAIHYSMAPALATVATV